MRKTNIVLIIALGLALLAGLALNPAGKVFAQEVPPVGIVVAYTPGVSITIVDQQGNQIEYALDAAVKIEPADGEKSLKVGSYVTIIAPASISKGKQIAVGIVVHPDKELLPPGAALVKNTAAPTDVPATATTKVSETPTPAESAAATPIETFTATPKEAANVKADGTAVKSNSFIEWLRSLLQQLLGSA